MTQGNDQWLDSAKCVAFQNAVPRLFFDVPAAYPEKKVSEVFCEGKVTYQDAMHAVAGGLRVTKMCTLIALAAAGTREKSLNLEQVTSRLGPNDKLVSASQRAHTRESIQATFMCDC
jgi:hypothetical protein